ncbi:MAG: ubiquinol-cytochrome c reductase iron-sulfur subunit [Chloroflexi bacterium]|nr:ubiquinol-cytochrome c reductase iron-sulfur subunit [Ktedonobacteraceae bacterium]MBV9020721.1 ubiquinol-cytochrome c reductase iron-sulfur subunit [Ktedonobacteraceae bacterium]MBV9706375.1 ubiquinol-cytochrome c reductase iron-sulfur subunit [Chloroflexota bacterium]
MSIDTPPITPQQYEVLHGGGAEAAEIAQQRLSRRRFLRRSMLAVWGLSTTASVAGALYMLYPNLAGQFGSAFTVGKKTDFPSASKPADYQLGAKGVFYYQSARTYLVHMATDTAFLLSATALKDQLTSESIVKDSDGSYWAALYQRCVHLGCTVPFRNDCSSFKCPCHGSHYNVDGEYLDGPAPRSLDRFALSFSGEDVVVDTGSLNNSVPHPDVTTRLIAPPSVLCSAGG